MFQPQRPVLSDFIWRNQESISSWGDGLLPNPGQIGVFCDCVPYVLYDFEGHGGEKSGTNQGTRPGNDEQFANNGTWQMFTIHNSLHVYNGTVYLLWMIMDDKQFAIDNGTNGNSIEHGNVPSIVDCSIEHSDFP